MICDSPHPRPSTTSEPSCRVNRTAQSKVRICVPLYKERFPGLRSYKMGANEVMYIGDDKKIHVLVYSLLNFLP